MHFYPKHGNLCFSALAILVIATSYTTAADAADSSTKSSQFKTTRRTTPASRKLQNKSSKYKRPISTKSAKINLLMTSDLSQADQTDANSEVGSGELTNAQLRQMVSYLSARLYRLERLTGFRSRRSRRAGRRQSLNSKVSGLEQEVSVMKGDLKRVIAAERNKSNSRRKHAVRRKQNRQRVENFKENVGNTTKKVGDDINKSRRNASNSARKTTKKVQKGIKNGAKQAKDTFNNMMPGGK